MEDFDTTQDIGIAVKDDDSIINTNSTSSKKKKKRRKRKRSASEASNGSDGANSARVSNVESNENSNHNNDEDDINGVSSGQKKKKKKKKRKSINLLNNEYTASTSTSSSQLHMKQVHDNAKKTKMVMLPPLKGNYIKERSNLPVYQHRSELCTLVAENDVVLVVAETVRQSIMNRFISLRKLCCIQSIANHFFFHKN